MSYRERRLAQIDREQSECAARGLAPHHAPSLHIHHEPKLDAHLSDEDRKAKRLRLEAFVKANQR